MTQARTRNSLFGGWRGYNNVLAMENERIKGLFKDLYNGDPWIGITILSALEGISPQQAASKPLPNCNSIWEIVNHLVSWRKNVLQRIQGKIMQSPSNNYFEPIKDPSFAAWQQTLKNLHQSQTEWIKMLQKIEKGSFETVYPPNNLSYYAHIHGIMHHDAYHLGQIVMLSKFFELYKTPDNYHTQFLVNTTDKEAYKAVTEKIPLWWTEGFSGSSGMLNDEFTVRFGSTFKTMKIVDLIPNKKIAWWCMDALIDIPELKNNTDWKYTTIVWDIRPIGNDTEISITHIGLTPRVACYEICETGWESFIASLKLFLDTGKGTPYKNENE